MFSEIDERTINAAKFIFKTGATVRKTALVFGVSKSTIHNDMLNRLKKIDAKLFEKIRMIMEINFKEKHIRGGEKTREKYLNNK